MGLAAAPRFVQRIVRCTAVNFQLAIRALRRPSTQQQERSVWGGEVRTHGAVLQRKAGVANLAT